MKQVLMNMEFEVEFQSGELERLELDKGDINFDIGGYAFVIDGKTVPFDFAATCYCKNLNNYDDVINIEYESGKSLFFNEYDVDDVYEDEYRELGLSMKDITAPFLASAKGIEEIYIWPHAVGYEDGVPCDPKIRILSIQFADEKGESFPVDKAVIDIFNESKPYSKGIGRFEGV